MTNETKKTLLLVLNSNEKPAFIVDDNSIVLINEAFTKNGFTNKNYKDKAKEAHCQIVEKKLDDNLVLCEIVNCDLYLLQQSQLKLSQAMALL
jgi:hypothetical protein